MAPSRRVKTYLGKREGGVEKDCRKSQGPPIKIVASGDAELRGTEEVLAF
jgi:hypothetical protein